MHPIWVICCFFLCRFVSLFLFFRLSSGCCCCVTFWLVVCWLAIIVEYVYKNKYAEIQYVLNAYTSPLLLHFCPTVLFAALTLPTFIRHLTLFLASEHYLPRLCKLLVFIKALILCIHFFFTNINNISFTRRVYHVCATLLFFCSNARVYMQFDQLIM